MPEAPNLEELLKSGAHFGHLTRRWNPKMKEFIFMERNGIHIIDLKKTEHYFQEALDQVSHLARSGKTILFVGTKKQAQDIVRTEAIRCGMPYVTHRWLGGMLTNFSTVRKSISRMEEIDRMEKDGTFDELTKKEALMLDREREKLEQTLGGIANMNHTPGAIFVVDTIKEHIAVNEAVKLNIPIVAMVDTNSDPDIPDYIIPCNDDSARTIQLIASRVADAVIAGNAEREAQNEEELLEQAAEEARASEGRDQEDRETKKPSGKRRKRRKRVAKASPESDMMPEDEGDEPSGDSDESKTASKEAAGKTETASEAESEGEDASGESGDEEE